jgi:hypothetical protein
LTSSPPFALCGAASHPTDVVTPLRCVTFPFYGAKMSSMPPLYLPLRLVASSLKPKLKNWIHTTAVDHPLSLNRLTPSFHYYKNVISTLTTLSITQPRLHFTSPLIRAWHPSSLCITTPSDELTDSLSIPAELIIVWIHVKRYFKIPQHHAGL